MARDPLQALATLRRLAVDAARQELAKCENYQAALSSHISACDTAIVNNERTDRDPVDHAPVAVVHRYVEKLNRRSNLLRQHVPIAQMKIDAARNALSLARLAEKAIQEVTLSREQARSAEANRHAQHALDDMARRTIGLWR
jgi:flagellar export protein FliJ